MDWLNGAGADRLEHAELEDQLQTQGRALLRRLLQDHLDLRAGREHRVEVSDSTRRRTRRWRPGMPAGWAPCSAR